MSEDVRGFASYDAATRSPCLDPAVVTIRGATVDDVEALARLAVAENRRSPTDADLGRRQDGRGSVSLEHWRDLFENNARRDDRHLTVAEGPAGIVGYGRTAWFAPAADAPPDTAPAGWYLIGLSVDPAWRRRGIARALTAERLAWVATRAREAWYFANADNRVCLGLHASFGFVEVTRRFSFPGVTFRGGTGVLSRVDLASS